MKINFEKLPCYVDIRKAVKMEMNVKFEFSNQMYINGHGVSMGALAIKIYNSQGEEEYTDEECRLIMEFAQNYPPVFSDSINELIKNGDNKESEVHNENNI